MNYFDLPYKKNKSTCHIKCSFCSKIYENEKQCKKCKLLFDSSPENSSGVCKYGFSYLKSKKAFICGFINGENYNKKLIKGHLKNNPKLIIDKNETTNGKDDLLFGLKVDLCHIYSQTVHELIHFCGQLRSLIDVVRQEKYDIKKYDFILNEYHRYIVVITDYEKQREKRPLIQYDLFCRYKTYICSMYDQYQSLIEKCTDISDRLDQKMENKCTLKQFDFMNSHIKSFVSMQSLFSFRMKYNNALISEYKGEDVCKILNKHFFNWHKVTKKLANILSYSAKNKDISFSFNGKTETSFQAYEDLYLAVYILLENALKYAPQSSNILLSFNEEEKSSCLTVTNSSENISVEKCLRIFEKGVVGENAKKEGDGLGLYIAKRIFDRSGIASTVAYENGQFCIKCTCAIF